MPPEDLEDLEWKVYLITNAVNGKGYVGITYVWPIDIRLRQHFTYAEELPADAYMSNGRSRPLYAAMRKYGVDKFSIEVLGMTEGPDGLYEILELEKTYIEEYETYGPSPMHKRNGYNVTGGGEWPFDPDYGVPQSQPRRLDRLTKILPEQLGRYQPRDPFSIFIEATRG